MKTLEQIESKLQANINRLTDLAYSSFPSNNLKAETPRELLGGRKCRTCGVTYTHQDDIDFIIEVGECICCDHVRGELIADMPHSEEEDQ